MSFVRSVIAAAAVLVLALAPAEATLRTTISAAIVAAYEDAAALGASTFNSAKAVDIILKSGTGSYQADRIFADQRTLAASASEDLDLAGSLSDPLGVTVTCAKLKAVMVRAASANTNNVLVGGAASNQVAGIFSATNDVVAVAPGGAFLWVAPAAGVAVTGGSSDLLKIANSGAGTAVTYDVVIICTSA